MDTIGHEWETAIETLRTYGPGSSRGGLMALDQAAIASLKDPPARGQLEQRLLALLASPAPAEARAYVCRKLALIGSAASVPALAACLADSDLADEARAALESIPAPEAVKALRAALPRLAGLQQVGVVQSLGARRDAGSVAELSALLKEPDRPLAAAAAAALGNVGTPKAAAALRRALADSPPVLRSAVADAGLECAERLRAEGKPADARKLLEALRSAEVPRPAREAAVRGLGR